MPNYLDYFQWSNAQVTPFFYAAYGSIWAATILFRILKEKSRYSHMTFAGFIMKGGVVPPGIEPGTHGFSVRCSTN